MITRHHLKAKRVVKDKDEMDAHYRTAESQYYRIKAQNFNMYGNKKIDFVEYIENSILMQRFEKKQKEFQQKYLKEEETDYILAFHGTPKMGNIENIITNNFSMSYAGKHGQVHGAGIYFSEFPDVSEGYTGNTNCLLLCKILQGSTEQGDSKKVLKNGETETGWAVIIQNIDQILPCYIIHLKNQF